MIDAIYRNPRTQQMYVRRLWSVMEEQLQPPNTPASDLKFENRINELQSEIAPEVVLDVAKWGAPNWGTFMTFQQGIDQMKNGYFAPRRSHLFQTHTQSQVLPGPPQFDANILISNTEPDPASGDDDEEWIELTNTTPEAIDMSGWDVSGGISFTFPLGTVLPAGGKIYLSPNIEAFRSRNASPTGGEGNFVVGPYDGNYRSTESIFIWDTDGLLIGSNSTSFELFINDLVAGQDARFSIAGAAQSTPVFIGYSLSGDGPTNTQFGTVDLTNPISSLPRLLANSGGTVYLTLPITPSLIGRQIWFQAVNVPAGELSNSETRTVQ